MRGIPTKCLYFVENKHLILMYGYVWHSPNATLPLKKLKTTQAVGVAQASHAPSLLLPPYWAALLHVPPQPCSWFCFSPREKWSGLITGSVARLGSSLGYSGFSFRSSFSRQSPRVTVDQEVPQNQVGTESAGVKLDNDGPRTLQRGGSFNKGLRGHSANELRVEVIHMCVYVFFYVSVVYTHTYTYMHIYIYTCSCVLSRFSRV